nr:4Fe-4S binding protein [Saprospiraceae bacterium]
MTNEFLDTVIEDNEEYRDHIATVDQSGKRIWLYPKKPSGRFYNARTWVSFAFLAIFLLMPFIKIDGEQFLQFNVLERRFVLFGLVFTPQDFHLFVLAMLTFIVFIILFTVVYGRLFCGWVCPQTVFMEMFFRKIEYWIEGDTNEQRRLDKAPWTADKIRKKTIKHLVFFIIGVVVSNYFLAYIIGMDAVIAIIREPVDANFGGFIAMLIFSGIFYGVFARLREQVCTTICPYGRLQGVLLVHDSIVVAYDHVRGEPRGKLKKEKPAEPARPAQYGNPVDHIRAAVGTATSMTNQPAAAR